MKLLLMMHLRQSERQAGALTSFTAFLRGSNKFRMRNLLALRNAKITMECSRMLDRTLYPFFIGHSTLLFLRFRMLWQFLFASFAIPFTEFCFGYFTLFNEYGKFSPLRFAFKRHSASYMGIV